eukprot:FR739742.1.p1 GENE.FR739742.1~~FR739742.1.p1  ORF type:complete len:135 (+),score=21.76 FR739742.1:2-406(+)
MMVVARDKALEALKLAMGDELVMELKHRASSHHDLADRWALNKVPNAWKEVMLDCYRVVAVGLFYEKQFVEAMEIVKCALDHVSRRREKTTKMEKEIITNMEWVSNMCKIATADVSNNDHGGWTFKLGWVEGLE